MPLDPIEVDLSDGQKLEALKRYQRRYQDELEELETDITAIKTGLAEFEFVSKYLGEQPEVKELQKDADRLDKLEQRRSHIGMLLERLDQVLAHGGDKAAAKIQRF